MLTRRQAAQQLDDEQRMAARPAEDLIGPPALPAATASRATACAGSGPSSSRTAARPSASIAAAPSTEPSAKPPTAPSAKPSAAPPAKPSAAHSAERAVATTSRRAPETRRRQVVHELARSPSRRDAVLQHQQDRLPAASARRNATTASYADCAPRPPRRPSRTCRSAGARLRDQPGQRHRPLTHHVAEHRPSETGDLRRQRVGERLEEERTLDLVALRPQDDPAGGPRDPYRLIGQPGLADARLAHDQQHGGPPRPGRRPRPGDRGHLLAIR